MLVTIGAGIAVLSPFFLTVPNLQNLVTQSSIIATLAIGQLLVIVSRGVDVSVGSIVAFSTIAAVAVLGTGTNAVVFGLATILAGGAIGVANGLIIASARLPQPLLVTIAMLGIARGLAQVISGGSPIVGLPPGIVAMGNGRVMGIPVPFLIVLGLALLFVYLTRFTQWGRWIYAIGDNPEGAARIGLPARRIVFSVFVISGLMAGIAGLITAGRTNAASPLAGVTLELEAITAVIIGGASLFGGRGSVMNALVGALLLGTVRNGLDLVGVQPFWQTVVIGLIILFALELDAVRRRLEARLQVLEARLESDDA